jgi:hypothetical protein
VQVTTFAACNISPSAVATAIIKSVERRGQFRRKLATSSPKASDNKVSDPINKARFKVIAGEHLWTIKSYLS